MFVHFINFALLYLVGVGQIVVDDSGQNCVVTVNGANDHLTINDVLSSREMLSKAKIMLCELTIPQQTVLAGLKLANELGGNKFYFLLFPIYTKNSGIC